MRDRLRSGPQVQGASGTITTTSRSEQTDLLGQRIAGLLPMGSRHRRQLLGSSWHVPPAAHGRPPTHGSVPVWREPCIARPNRHAPDLVAPKGHALQDNESLPLVALYVTHFTRRHADSSIVASVLMEEHVSMK